MSACTEAGCDGTVAADGYCDTCGMAASSPAPASAVGVPGAAHAAPPRPTQVSGACAEPGCDGTISADGYCDTCGMAAAPQTGSPRHSFSGGSSSAPTPSIAAPSQPGTSRQNAGTSRRTRSQRTGRTSRSRLGAGLVAIAPTEPGDPAAAVMTPEKIAAALGEVDEEERFCSSCGLPVGRSIDGREGRIQGFCSNCRTPFDFHTNAPALSAGELVGGQYEILGPIAHGGMGWIYLGRDNAVSNRWVVLKGLLNEDDPDAALAAVAERQFLARIEHANIVNIYNFVTHLGRGYIVMEYVGGQSLNGKLKERRRNNAGVPDPLPVADAIAYVLGILPAFGYLHDLGLVYNDLKPANIMAVGDDVKLIDVGAVMGIDDDTAAIFGTQGFQAPEVASLGPTVASDLFTIGRTLAVLILDFVFHAGDYQYQIPPPAQGGVLAQWESLHRFLLKCTAEHPDDRFQTAAETRQQLTGVLREVVTVTEGTPRPAPSTLFGGDRLTALLVDEADLLVTEADWRALPTPRVQEDDPAAAFLEDLVDVDPQTAVGLLEAAIAAGQVPQTPEVNFAQAHAAIALGQDPNPYLAAVREADPWDWRVEWFRSLHYLATNEPVAAAEGFSRVWTETPGEVAPRLAVALAAEQAGQYARAANLYERVVSIDTTYVTAAFGLARCHRASGDADRAVDAYRRVPPSSATYQDAQVASARALISGDGSLEADDLAAAAATIERLQLDATERARLAAEVLEGALALHESGQAPAGVTLFGHDLDDRGIRRGLESTYRELARLSAKPAEKAELVDRANTVRPRSLF